MIYLRDITGAQDVYIPRNIRVYGADGWALELRNRTTGKRAVFSDLLDLEDKHLYVALRVDLAGKQIAKGEYFYTLRNGDTAVTSGILTVGETKTETKIYQEDRQMIQYNG